MLWRCVTIKRSPVVGNRARGNSWRLYLCGKPVKIRSVLKFILFIAILPPLHLILKYHEEIWHYCPYQYFEYDTDTAKAKCEMPTLNLWDPTIKKFLDDEHPIDDCAKDYPLVELTWSPLNPEEPSKLQLTERGRKEISHLRCIWQTITRNSDDKTLDYGREHDASFPMNMPAELVQIACDERSSGDRFYTDAFGTIFVNHHGAKADNSTKKRWNIMVLGIDSVSRQSFIRFLPKSFEWLRNQDGVHIFDAYHKIGENTFPNLVPMLTGRKVELSSPKETMQLPHSGNLVTYALGMPFDNYPFIWKDFKAAGYRTGYVEDDPQIGTFNLMRRGFSEQPTDHYGRPLFLSFDAYRDKEHEVNPSLTKFNETTGHWVPIEPHYFCINGRKKFELLWDYSIRQFLTRYSAYENTFMFSWLVALTHEWLTTIKQADDPLLDTLKFLLEDPNQPAPWRDNTFVFLLSDHGQRVDKIRSSFVGRLEDRLPFLAVSIPPAFRQKYPKMSENLAENTKHLVTALDLYATFKHIFHLSTADESQLSDSPDLFSDVGPSGYAVSLFQKVDPLRSCISAGIPEWYCACHQYTVLEKSSKEADLAGSTLVRSIIADLSEGIQQNLCANLSLESVESIRKVEYTKSALTYTKTCRFFGIIKEADAVEDVFDEYVVQIKTKPGQAIFEATVRNHWKSGDGWKIIGGVERVNRYGTQSSCLPNNLERLRKICFCPSSLQH